MSSIKLKYFVEFVVFCQVNCTILRSCAQTGRDFIPRRVYLAQNNNSPNTRHWGSCIPFTMFNFRGRRDYAWTGNLRRRMINTPAANIKNTNAIIPH